MDDTASSSVDNRYEVGVGVISNFVARGLMPPPEGRTVWDLGCGHGDFAGAFERMGAEVIASDLYVQASGLPDAVTVVEGDFDAVTERLGGTLHDVDLVFMHLMTEHVEDLKSFLADLHSRLRVGCELIVHHDNYFQPTGHHDHGLIAYSDATGGVEPQGVRCWEAPERCAASESHRQQLRTNLAWTWSDASEATMDPTHCTDCNYFRRSRPWAHLIYGRDLLRTFPEPWFRQHLNRLGPEQVAWDLQDVGFTILRDDRFWLNNDVPVELAAQFGRDNLLTFTITLRAIKL